MSIYYSPSNRAFYDDDVHETLPNDAKAIAREHHAELLDQQGAGLCIVPGPDGFPVAESPAAPTLDQIQRQLTAVVQRHLDAKAQELGFDNIFTAVTYADEPSVPSFQAHGLALRSWRSKVWGACYALLTQVQSGHAPVPSPRALIAALPAFGE